MNTLRPQGSLVGQINEPRAKRGGGWLPCVIASVLVVSLSSCTQLTAATDRIAELCDRALPLAQLAAPIPIVGAYIAAGVTVGCTTADGLARLRADANSAVWLAEQIGLLRAALRR